MAFTETNDRKRVEMSTHLIRLRDLGWTTAQLAALMRVQPGTVNSWKRAASMGTNAQRATLAKLGSPVEERPRMREVAAQLRREADISDQRSRAAHLAGAHVVENNHLHRAARLRERARFLESI